MQQHDDNDDDQAFDEDLHAGARTPQQEHVGNGGDDQRADYGPADRAFSAVTAVPPTRIAAITSNV